MYSTFLLAVTATVPRTLEWSPKVGLVMIIANIIAIAFGKATIQRQKDGPLPGVFGGLSLGALLGTTSFGHILGVGAILGLSYLGAL